jgi:hypothetical protein
MLWEAVSISSKKISQKKRKGCWERQLI